MCITVHIFFYLFLANIGGQLGLFVGASIITLMELFQYLIEKGYNCFISRREKKKERRENACSNPEVSVAETEKSSRRPSDQNGSGKESVWI